jgi:sugar lactone lactonase YvrE
MLGLSRSMTLVSITTVALLLCACGDDGGGGGSGGNGGTTEVGTFEGLFDNVATGYNFPLDIAIVPNDVVGSGSDIVGGDILAANYGTSEILLAVDPSGPAGDHPAQPFYDGTQSGLSGATAVAMAPDGNVWATFEQGGDGDNGAVVVLSPSGEELLVIDGATEAGAFARPGGICYGGLTSDESATWFYMVNMDDGTAWRIDASSWDGSDATMTRVGSGLATGNAGSPGSPGSPLSSSSDLPEDGARGCAYHDGRLYVADAQNAQIVRFDDADLGEDLSPALFDDAPTELITYPTGVTINNDGALIVISYDNAHAFVSLLLPHGTFHDNGLQELNVNSGNHGVQVANDTIWFTRANNSNGSLRAVTIDQDHPPSTAGDFPVQ